MGFRYRLHRRDLLGRPDLVFPGRGAVIFAHGCFWHAHGCPMCRAPATRAAFWATKIADNRFRDEQAVAGLRIAGWRVMLVWECALRGPTRLPAAEVLAACGRFLTLGPGSVELAGNWNEPAARKER